MTLGSPEQPPAAEPAPAEPAAPEPPAAPSTTASSDAARGEGTGALFEPAGVTWTPVSPRLVTARRLVLVLGGLVPVVPVVVAALLSGLPWLLVVLAPWVLAVAVLWWVVGRQVRAIGYAERQDDLLIRSGVLFRSMVVVPYGRMQYVDVQAGPLDRALNLAKVQLHTASPGTDAAIPGLAPEEAARLRERLASRGEARLAGL